MIVSSQVENAQISIIWCVSENPEYTPSIRISDIMVLYAISNSYHHPLSCGDLLDRHHQREWNRGRELAKELD
jgi:hypothetical protein